MALSCLSVKLPSSFLFSSSLQLVKAAQDCSHSCLCILLSSSLLKKSASFLFSPGWKGWLEMFSVEGCVCLVCLSSFNNFIKETSEGRNHLNLDDGLCHVLLLFKVWPGKILWFHDSYISSFQGEGHQGKKYHKTNLLCSKYYSLGLSLKRWLSSWLPSGTFLLFKSL